MSHDISPLDPARIDAFIDAALRADQTDVDEEARFVRALHGSYVMPTATRVAVLERVRERLRVEQTRTPQGNADDQTDKSNTLELVAPPVSITPRPRGGRPMSRLQSTFGAIAAVLIVALLGAAFYAVTQGANGRILRRTPSQSATAKANLGPVGVWQDVSVSDANTGGHLDFDPSKGVAYAAAISDGSLYVCGSGHLWYSRDGGASYTAFTPALPSSFAAEISGACTMTTVEGWPGLFIAPNGNSSGRSVLYAAVGDASWQKLIMSGSAQAPGGGSLQAQVDGGQIWSDLFQSGRYESMTPPVAASGQWLFFQSAAQSSPGGAYDLIGTDDFGQSWVDVSAADTGSDCGHFAVAPANPTVLACQPTSSGGIAETVDGGKTWAPLTGGANNNLYLVGMSADLVYGMYADPLYTEHIVTHDIKSGVWVDGGSLFAVDMGGPVAVTPADTYYFPVLDDKTATQLAVYTYSAGSQGFQQVLGFMTVPGASLGTRLYGGLWPGESPAIYSVVTPPQSNPESMYRLFLPSSGTASAQPTPTTPATATAIGDVACTGTPANPSSVQSGGVGAETSTFAARWGAEDGVAMGTSYYGPKTSQGVPEIGVTNGYAHAYMMFYNVDNAKQLTIAQATTLAQSILPTDATALTPLQRTPGAQNRPDQYQQLFCSAAFLADESGSGQTTLYPVPRNGVIQVSYTLRQDGSIGGIAFRPVQ